MTVFDDMLGNEKLQQIVTELFIRGRKLNISFVFITRSYFAVPNNISLNFTHHFIVKTPSKRELANRILVIHQILNLKNL